MIFLNDKISVVIPIYNCEKSLSRCLNSVVNQSYKNLEILLIDDGSVDKSPDICDEYGKMDSRIKVFHRENSGVSSTRNFGINVASGNYIAFVDSDDVIELSMYEKLIKKAKESDSDMTFCDFDTIGRNDVVVKIESSFGRFLKTGDFSLFVSASPAYRIMGSVWRILFKRNFICSISFNEDIILGEDLLFVLQALSSTQNISYINEVLYHYYFQGKVNYLKYINRNEYFFSQQVLTEELAGLLRKQKYMNLANVREWETYVTTWKMILCCNDWKKRLKKIPNKFFWESINRKENYIAFKNHNKHLRFKQNVANFLIFHNLFRLYRFFGNLKEKKRG